MNFDHMTTVPSTKNESPAKGLSKEELKAISDKIIRIASESGILERCGYTADFAKTLYNNLITSESFPEEYMELFKLCADDNAPILKSARLPILIVEQCNAAGFNDMLRKAGLIDLLYGDWGPDNEKDETMLECIKSAIKLNGLILEKVSPPMVLENGDISPIESYEMAIKYCALHPVTNITKKNPLAWVAIDVALNAMQNHNIEFEESDFDTANKLLEGFLEVLNVGKVNGFFPEDTKMEVAFMTTSLEKAIEHDISKEED